jgi:hypothetical protein
MGTVPVRKIPITVVRYSKEEGIARIHNFIFGGKYGLPRVPRGVEPEVVSHAIRQNLKPESSPDAYERTLETIRFYERPDVVPGMMLALKSHEANAGDVRRSTYVLQAAGDFGSEDVSHRAGQYLDATLVPNPSMLDALPQMVEALVALSLSASPTKFAQRIQNDMTKAAESQNSSEEGMRNYQRLASFQRNDLRKTVTLMDHRKRLASLQPGNRRAELVQIYLGQSPLSTAQMETWAARLLRAEALFNPEPVFAEFTRAIDAIAAQKLAETASDILILRAAQAILYLQGSLSPQHQAMYEKAKKVGAMNFLWDDLG